jgi:hypothetical protein
LHAVLNNKSKRVSAPSFSRIEFGLLQNQGNGKLQCGTVVLAGPFTGLSPAQPV